MLLLDSCASHTKLKVAQGPDFETWCVQSKLATIGVAEEIEAKASEMAVHKLSAQLGGGLNVRVQRGINIKDGSAFSTTSFYELQDSKGSSVLKFPSLMASPGFEGNFRVWSSSDSSLILVYEWIVTGVDSHEMYFVFRKDEDRWSAQGVEIPLFRGLRSDQFLDDPNQGAGNTGPYGPHVLGVAGRTLIIIPKRGNYRRVRVEELEAAHPFPFIVG